MQKTTFKSFAAAADGNPPGCDHVAVETDDGCNWGCFGRGVLELKSAPDCHQVAEGQGYSKWGDVINGNDYAGLVNEVSGRCHNVANRILSVAGTDVRLAGADVAIMFLYGKYGFNIPGLLDRAKAGAAQVNMADLGTLSNNDVQAVIDKINNVEQDELEIIEEYFQKALGQNFTLTQDEKSGVARIYGDFFNKRLPVQSMPGSYFDNLKPIFLSSLTQLEVLLGQERFVKIFAAAPKFVTDALGPGFSLAQLAK